MSGEPWRNWARDMLAGNDEDGFRDAHPSIPWRAIRGARNKAVHQYWGTDAGVLWLTVTQSLPALRAELLAALEEAP
ncbi:MAG: DUF86 domain-containing protein [Armatimonadetes bacterium]|nr:DUF86 domain-containing protein [Armatimonadota bacterium]